MKAIIFNNNNAVILDIDKELSSSYNNEAELISNNFSITLSLNNTILFEGTDEMAKSLAESLVGSDGEVTIYNPNQREFHINKVSAISNRNNKKIKVLRNENKTNY